MSTRSQEQIFNFCSEEFTESEIQGLVKKSYKYFRVQNGKNIKFYINPQKSNLKIDFLSRIDFKGDVKSKKKKFVLDDPKKLFSLIKNNYKELYTIKIKDSYSFMKCRPTQICIKC